MLEAGEKFTVTIVQVNSIRNAGDRVIAEDSPVQINLISNPVTSELYSVCETIALHSQKDNSDARENDIIRQPQRLSSRKCDR
ncbi:hypothetical protein [Microcoleus sp. BROC3]|uniref:hypothetical protein n=1 Tax=Microcoleus sp. BROC3 TaxID=3055323 RepID=UPI002FCF19EA